MLYTMKDLLEVANRENFAIPAPNIQNEMTGEGGDRGGGTVQFSIDN